MKLALCSFPVALGNAEANANAALRKLEEASACGAELVVFPPFTLTGASCGKNLFDLIAGKASDAWRRFCGAAEKLRPFVIAGYPEHEGKEYFNHPVISHPGWLIASDVKIGVRTAFSENVASPEFLAETGADITVVQLACPESVHGFDRRLAMAKAESARTGSVVVLCAGGQGESTTDCVWTSQKAVFFDGREVASSGFDETCDMLVVDIDVGTKKAPPKAAPRDISDPRARMEEQAKDRTPFTAGLPDAVLCRRIVSLQTRGLLSRMRSLGRDKLVLGISGGLDSTVALLTCVTALQKAGLPVSNILGVSMPGPGTSARTRANAQKLMRALGVTALEIDIRAAVHDHLTRIGQPTALYDITYEQTQSRERTQILLDLANKEKGIVVGTGDMSEFALGWMSYGGDHLSMYAVAAGIPKTVVRLMAHSFVAEADGELRSILADILATPVSPELLPLDPKGEQKQKTEVLVGAYAVHDYFLFHVLADHWNVYALLEGATVAFDGLYSRSDILRWLRTFVTRFFTRQWKRNCWTDGPQVFDVGLSPRTGFHLPGDVSPEPWLDELNKLGVMA